MRQVLMYKQVVRPVLFTIDPEKIHRQLVAGLKLIEHSRLARQLPRALYAPPSQDVGVTIHGILFANPIGLSAGFDKNADAFRAIGSFGFGFLEVGTITTRPQPGNPAPRVFRLPDDDALVSRTGFNNHGLHTILPRVRGLRDRGLVLGANINKNPDTTGEAVLEEFHELFSTLYPEVDFFTINLTYPEHGRLLGEEGKWIVEVFRTLVGYRNTQSVQRPIFAKVPADLTEEQLMDVGETLIREQIQGVVATGPTTTRDGFVHSTPAQVEACGAGGASGRPLKGRSLQAVRCLRKAFGDQITIIGAGGIMTGADALEMKEAGADLIEIYSAFIYSGPAVLKEMARAWIKSPK
jgi:dihydroorotate dehydrogenase